MKQNYLPSTDKLCIKTTEGYIFINFFDVVCLEADHNLTKIYLTTQENPILMPGNLKHNELFFPLPEFFRCHKSHVINLHHISKYDDKSLLLHTTVGPIPLAKDRVKDFEENYLTRIDKLCIKTCEGYIFNYRYEIVYLEADHNQTKIYLTTQKKPILMPGNLKHNELLFPLLEFFRCHKSYVINLVHVLKYDDKSLIIDTIIGQIPLAEEKVKDFEDKMI